MKRFLSTISRTETTVFICCGLLVCLIYSKFMLSVCMILLIAVGLFDLRFEPKFKMGFNPKLRQRLQYFFQYKPFVVVTFIFFLVLFSGLYSEDTRYFLERLRIRLPFLLLPFAFAFIPPLSSRQYLSIFYFLIVLMCGSSFLVGIDYWSNFETINVAMRKGQTIPTPMNHIRYSLLMAFSILAGASLVFKRFKLKYDWERFLIIAMTIYLFVFIHILSVRSGLIVLYLSIFLLSIRFIFLSKRIVLGLSVIGLLTIAPVVAYFAFPSFQNRISYAKYDFQQYLRGESKGYSDAERLISLEVGLKIGSEHKILGVGAGDLRKEVVLKYQQDYPKIENRKMPHNQFVSVFAGTGIIGLCIFIFAFFFPLFYQKNYMDSMFFSLHVMVFFSFMVENTIETSIGTAFYVFFLLLGLNFLGKNKTQ